MFKCPHQAVLALLIGLLSTTVFSSAQEKADAGLSPEKAIALANQGHCRESLPALKKAMASQTAPDTKKKAGVTGVRCALAIDDRDTASDLVRMLSRQFGHDPDVLFVLVHAYSDLSTRAAQDLAQTAPHSMAAHKLNAEALEMQGKWQPAQLEYEGILEKNPKAPGIHFLIARSLLSRPDAGPEAAERAKQELLKELQIDPNNAPAQDILGELAKRDAQWDEAISRFSQAAKLDADFGEAYLGWGTSLVSVKKYEEAVQPLRNAARLMPGNPVVHNALGTALERSGHKDEAAKEFAIHRSITSAGTGADNSQ
ncbi:MAG TPA: tetratricopeptide repeat protein [Terriglobales bacterium]|jgi:tetratricopeptide (TPR) repeat protein|nr:tetratricopeptide repeat protein [Terriglobales bacterium]